MEVYAGDVSTFQGTLTRISESMWTKAYLEIWFIFLAFIEFAEWM